ncbi:MAG: ABC transporter permease [Clostridium argentinense]|uniref:ABC transporter permease n=1 Tax=Clostridium faecium TaxID=2762223 RepID=A0ABR8YVZ4_9CLOT|nr:MULTISPECIES: ABC transporter permease [Clostridium]MBD8048349.1 ABC transporter permease [Clostridium faecium]MBS5822299.1 ABC transporter permease [Clostridium argentinense]MDU1348525.1 ABC transporter permease [Clostridium argentinense]
MKQKFKGVIDRVGLPRVIITAFFILLCILAIILKLPISMLMSDMLVRFGMNGVLVLAMLPGILCGIGLNFGLPIGILAGILGGLVSIELNLRGGIAFFVAIAIAIPIAALVGYAYGLLLNKVKGSEMMIGTYAGFSAVSLMCIGWLLLPFKSSEIRWPIGQGLRTTITLDGRYSNVLDNFLTFNIGKVKVPTGLILMFLLCCLLVWIFLKSKTGIMMAAGGSNNKFARASAIDVDKTRIIGTTLSTILGAIGILMYAQSYGFYQLYQAPMMMGFAAVAAILIGGASTTSAKISHVIIGTFLFQGLLTLGLPVVNQMFSEGNLSEVVRIIISNGIILYALTKARGGGSGE